MLRRSDSSGIARRGFASIIWRAEQVLAAGLPSFAGRSIVVATSSQLATALALIELDGVARRLTILPPDTAADHLAALIACAEADAVVVDPGTLDHPAFDLPVRVVCAPAVASTEEQSLPHLLTEWVLLTSGTSGVPKMAVHSLASLIAPIGAGQRLDGAVVWGTFYDIRRYGGLQIFLARDPRRRVAGALERRRADRRSSRPARPLRRDPYLGHAVALAPRADVARTGTISPRYVRLSGEIADQAILDSSARLFPQPASATPLPRPKRASPSRSNDGLRGVSRRLPGA